MRPASHVLSRLQWDPHLANSANILIGYLDRFEGIKEMPFHAWLAINRDVTEEEFVPQHRIRYFRTREGKVLWDKVGRVDEVFGLTSKTRALDGEEVAA